MPFRAKATSKGQITIPRDVRKLLGVRPGDSVVFECSNGGVRVRPALKEGVYEKYRGIGNTGIPSGRKAIIKYFRELRGHDCD